MTFCTVWGNMIINSLQQIHRPAGLSTWRYLVYTAQDDKCTETRNSLKFNAKTHFNQIQWLQWYDCSSHRPQMTSICKNLKYLTAQTGRSWTGRSTATYSCTTPRYACTCRLTHMNTHTQPCVTGLFSLFTYKFRLASKTPFWVALGAFLMGLLDGQQWTLWCQIAKIKKKTASIGKQGFSHLQGPQHSWGGAPGWTLVSFRHISSHHTVNVPITVPTCTVSMGNCTYWHQPLITLYLNAKFQLQIGCTSQDIDSWK